MPYAFALPTTSQVSFASSLSSSTHPSLVSSASTQRGVLRLALKAYKRCATSSRPSQLSSVQAALDNYLPSLLALDAGLCGRKVAGEEVDVVLAAEPALEWRPTLSQSKIPNREPARVKLQSFEYEVLFVLSTAATVSYLTARNHVRALYDTQTPTPEQRTAAVTQAMRAFLSANSIWSYLSTRAESNAASPVADISSGMLQGLASLALAEATLTAVLKDDPWPGVVTQDRNDNDTDWMIRAPEIPKVRALLFARLCIAGSDHAARAASLISSCARADEALQKYALSLQHTARAKACRMLGIDREASSKTGEALAWLAAAKSFLHPGEPADKDAKPSRLREWKDRRQERKEDRLISSGGEWGSDAGRVDETRVVAALHAKWTAMNDAVDMQPVPSHAALLKEMPSGREYHSPAPYRPPSLDEQTLARMRAPLDPEAKMDTEELDDDSDDDKSGRATGHASTSYY